MQNIPLTPSFDNFEEQASKGNLVPVYAELSADYETPISIFQKICNGKHSFLLESAESTDRAGRYSFIGSDPRSVIEARGNEITVTEGDKVNKYESETGDPLKDLELFMAAYQPVQNDNLPVFYGGAVGYLSYDAVKYFESTIKEPANDDLSLPDMVFMITNNVVIFDHRLRKILVVSNIFTDKKNDLEELYQAAKIQISQLIEKLDRTLSFRPLIKGCETSGIKYNSNTSKSDYCAMVEKAKEFIHAGDAFQIVLSQRLEVNFSGSSIDLYRALRAVNPSPYMFCLNLGEGFSLVGCSPEVHVRAIDNKIDIRPIAGTRWRGKTLEEDESLAEELLADPKERAEHIMLVDLARNDVGRVSDYDTVSVDEFMIVEKYSHVMHIVSNVSGKLASGKTAYDVMRATFPAGTVSGAPKVRAMQIINDLESNKRCAYSGAIGYFGYDGNHDSCIALRTAVMKGDKTFVQAGAGVVADSEPEYEYNETLNKAMGLIKAIEFAASLED